MKIGLMSYEVESASTIPQLFEKVKEYGCEQVQFSFHTYIDHDGSQDALMGRIPRVITDEIIDELAESARKNSIEIPVMAGFWNMISNNLTDRENGLLQLERIMQVCKKVDCHVINLCTGSKNDCMWSRSPENDGVKAWLDICRTMSDALVLAEHYGVQLGIEVEYNNVINSPAKARRLIDEMKSDYLKIIFDGANLFKPGECRKDQAEAVLKSAFDLLGNDIAYVHGKDVRAGDQLDFTYCGNGIVDFGYMMKMLKSLNYQGGMILHGAHSEDEIPASVQNARIVTRDYE